METLRLEALERHRILDTENDAGLDAIARLAADICEIPIALISLVDRNRQWFLAHVGTDVRETSREVSFCSHAIEQPDELLLVTDASSDPRFENHPLVVGDPFIRFYAGMPILSSDGFALGTLCVVGSVARGLSPLQERSLRALAAQATVLLESRRQIRELKGQLNQRRNAEENFQRASYVDAAGLPNRGLLVERVSRAYERLQKNPRMRAAVLVVGVGGVKIVDESLGHGMGDALMAAGVKRISRALRGDQTVARYGDSQIVILLEDIKSAAAATRIAQRILTLFDASFQIGEHSLRARANVGIRVTDGSHELGANLVRDAATAMSRAQESGAGTCELFSPDLRDVALRRMHLETDLRQALEQRELRLFYQPIVSISNGKTIGFEALVRWQHPARGLVMPDEFIRIAEETGLIDRLGEWVIRDACRQLRAWQHEDPAFESLAVSVNVSARQFRNPRFYEILTSALREAELDPSCLCVEITETALMEESDHAEQILHRLGSIGIKTHLDDFGCGYSSLKYLRRFPIETLKIDRSFISADGEKIADPEIVQTVIALALKLQMNVTAEGIETSAQLAQLKTFGCTHGQGYHFARPLPAGAVLDFLRAEGSSAGGICT